MDLFLKQQTSILIQGMSAYPLNHQLYIIIKLGSILTFYPARIFSSRDSTTLNQFLVNFRNCGIANFGSILHGNRLLVSYTFNLLLIIYGLIYCYLYILFYWGRFDGFNFFRFWHPVISPINSEIIFECNLIQKLF